MTRWRGKLRHLILHGYTENVLNLYANRRKGKMNLHLLDRLNDKELTSPRYWIRKWTIDYLDGKKQATDLYKYYQNHREELEKINTGDHKRMGYESQRVIRHFLLNDEIMSRKEAYEL